MEGKLASMMIDHRNIYSFANEEITGWNHGYRDLILPTRLCSVPENGHSDSFHELLFYLN
jgi:hypothetical protein